MDWTEPKPPTEGVCHYDHIRCETPLGLCSIEWKSWKDQPDYGVEIGNEYIGTEYSLEEAKNVAKEYLNTKRCELELFLNK